jgi:protein ImuB
MRPPWYAAKNDAWGGEPLERVCVDPVTAEADEVRERLCEQGRKVASLRPAARCKPSGSPAVAAAELWIGVHLLAGTELLGRLAARAQRFTPRVSIVPPDGLLLEVKGSLHLFNGVEGLSSSLVNECAALGVRSTLALAPTPLSALVAARCGEPLNGEPFTILGLTQLVSQLSPLPLAALRWPQETIDRLARIGVRTIGQVLRLPRAVFARRFGAEHLLMLDRLTGRQADPRHRFRARERFRRKRDLTYELESHEALLRALEPLLQELGKFLQARQCGIQQLECLLQHRHAAATSCILRLSSPASDARQLGDLLAERLNQLVLPEPVRSCELRSGSLLHSRLASSPLWQPGEHGGATSVEASGLIERLRARLGPEAVYGLQVLPGHRPENTWSVREPEVTPGTRAAAAARPPWPPFSRPLWLLCVPRLLSERSGRPRRRGPLRLLGDPERIETGWWDGGEIERDYYVAVDIHGVRLWVFRERLAPHRWFLQGVFG